MNGSVGRLPDFVVIGAMRSGTTSLHQWLNAHPDVFVPATKELHYFSFNFDRGEDWYTAQLAPAREDQKAGEASPDYLFTPAALERLGQRLPDARLVCVLRDPVDRAYSHYWQKRERGKEPLSFEDALAAEPQRISGTDLDRRMYSYLLRGRYIEQLRNVETLYPRSSLLVLLFDDIVADPAAAFSRVCAHIGVSAGVVPPEPTRRVNGYGAFRSVRVRNATRKLPVLLRDAIGRVNRRDLEYPPMHPDTRARLVEEFRADNEALAEWLGRDLSAWGA